MRAEWIVPDWPAPARVRAVSTTRTGGVSTGAYAALNLGAHVGDAVESVAENRRRLYVELDLHEQPRWLKQTHSAKVAHLNGHAPQRSPTADAAVTQSSGEVCVVMTADCLPVVFCDRNANTVAAAHAGWRGMAAGVLEATLAAMQTPAENILAWLGPAIGQLAYEVGDEVRAALTRGQPLAELAFEPSETGKWLCDLYLLASQRLQRAGIKHVYGGGFCTCTELERFFSYRRDGECGRMATMIWLIP
ncbi:MAG: peptidoglycan editing factor PgeF [Gammaproteobacteria bacterium]|nr:peptidoglycan editing factor PgeF [Gammaproteobacteria bacterium]